MDGSLLSGDKATVEKVLKELLDHPSKCPLIHQNVTLKHVSRHAGMLYN